ncbi:MAG: NAD(P)-dependent oxidoreductase [Ottowia sp.]|nr:NAD(P)-dependent oxidoreductase [Ottowia sp.]
MTSHSSASPMHSDNLPTDTQPAIAFLGLGVMGYPMAGHLARSGYALTVYNRTRHKAEQWVQEYGGQLAATPAVAAQHANMVFCCVGKDEDLRSVTLGEQGAFSSMASGSIFIDHTTASAQVARMLYANANKQGIAFIDAPVSGGQTGAVNGKLTVMCGGDQTAFKRVVPFITAYAQAVSLLGPSGSGQLAKMVNQICIAGLVQALSEAIAFGQRTGLDMKQVLDAIGKGAAASWQMQHRGESMLDKQFNFGFAVDWMRKDLGLCLDEAKRNGALLPITALVDQFYAEVQNMGGGKWDTSSLVQRLN